MCSNSGDGSGWSWTVDFTLPEPVTLSVNRGGNGRPYRSLEVSTVTLSVKGLDQSCWPILDKSRLGGEGEFLKPVSVTRANLF